MIRRLITSLFLLAVPGTASAQAMWGTIVDDNTGAAIAGAAIEVTPAGGGSVARTTSEATGEFRISLPGAGEFVVVARHIAYRTPEPSRIEVERNMVVFVELRLGRQAIPLQPLVVTAYRDVRVAGFYERMSRPGPGHFIDRERIDARPAARVSDFLAEIPGVQVDRADSGRPRTSLIALRGSRDRCSPTIYVDGLPVAQHEGSGVDDFIRPEALEGIEVYVGGSAPPPIETRATCGVVAFWTRPAEGDGDFPLRRLLMGAGTFVAMAALVLLSR